MRSGGHNTRMKPEDIRSANDAQMFSALKENPEVVRVNEALAKQEEDGGQRIRRHLLSSSVRLSEAMAPDIHKMAKQCTETLQLDIPVELYVFSSPQYNAACFKPEAGRLYVMFSSSLLEAFSESELRFVMGHELGHHVYRHHDIPIGYILKGKQRTDPRLALELFAWSRYAEISADRAGAHCAKDINSVGRALFKLASGLTDKLIKFSLDDFLAQVDEMQIQNGEPGQGAPKEDWFSTHPFSPLRVKALMHYDESVLSKPTGGISKADLEVQVQSLMSLMEPSYLEGRTKVAEAMRRALFAAAVTLANADGEISDEEKALFEKFFGAGTFSDKLSPEKLAGKMSKRLDLVREQASVPQRMQLIRDLCLIVGANRAHASEELAVLESVAESLEIPHSFIAQTLDRDPELD